MAEVSSPFLCLSGLDKMTPERLVLGPLSFWFPPGGGGVSITRTCELEELGGL